MGHVNLQPRIFRPCCLAKSFDEVTQEFSQAPSGQLNLGHHSFLLSLADQLPQLFHLAGAYRDGSITTFLVSTPAL